MHFSNLQSIALTALLQLATVGAAPATPPHSEPVLASFELRDQYDIAHKISFPTTHITVMTVADKKGSEQIDGWIAPLKERFGGRIAIEGVADMSKVPGFLRSMVREKFKKRLSRDARLGRDRRARLQLPQGQGQSVRHRSGWARDRAFHRRNQRSCPESAFRRG